MANLVSTILSWVMDLGYFGIMLGLMVEVIPSEIVLAYGGYLVSQGEITIVGSVIAGTIGGVFSQLFLYWLGSYGGRPFLDRYGKYFLINRHHLDVAENWFTKYGVGVIFTARFIPVVRHAISIPAGIAKMPAWKFILYTALAIIPWSILFISLGIQLGNRWRDIGSVASHYTTPLSIAAVVLIILYLFFNMRKKKAKR